MQMVFRDFSAKSDIFEENFREIWRFFREIGWDIGPNYGA